MYLLVQSRCRLREKFTFFEQVAQRLVLISLHFVFEVGVFVIGVVAESQLGFLCHAVFIRAVGGEGHAIFENEKLTLWMLANKVLFPVVFEELLQIIVNFVL